MGGQSSITRWERPLPPAGPIEWLERESKRYRLDELTRQCRDAYKRLDTVKVMQLLNGQRNLSGMDMRQLDLSDIDFRGASLYRARVDEANLSDAMLSGAGTNLQQASLCRVRAQGSLVRSAHGPGQVRGGHPDRRAAGERAGAQR